MAYHGYDYDENTGLSDEEIKNGLLKLDKEILDLPHPVAKAKAIEYVLQHTRIDINSHDYFIGIYSWNRLSDCITVDKWQNEIFSKELPEIKSVMNDLNNSGAVGIWPDFDHVVPDWKSILELGFKGLLDRSERYRREFEITEKLNVRQKAFFDGIKIEYTAIIAFIDRLYKYALTKKHNKANSYASCLLHLRDGAPTNTYEALQLIYIYFMISESVDHYQVRSLGNGLDNTLYKFYINDIKNGTFTRSEIKELLAYFLMQWQAIGNYWGQPFYLGGTNADGSTKINDLSYDIIDVYNELNIYNPKIQIKVNKNTPNDFLNKIFDLVRNGQNSFVFCCEPGMMRAVMSYGATFDEAREMDIRGCYETGVRANEVSTISGYLNPLKAILYVFSNGYDTTAKKQIGLKTGDISTFADFGDFYSAFLKQYENLIDKIIYCANNYEKYMEEINPSSMYSATVETSLKNAFDGYQGGVKFNNTSILNCGLGTAVDAIMAVYELVYKTKEVSIETLKTALDNNWQGYEKLRQKALKCKYKYGNGDALTDSYAQALSSFFTSKVNGRKNARGGTYKAILHSAMQFIWQGQKTEATPDGRKSGEEISKNASPTPGMDKNGVTALINSVTKLYPPSYPESFCLDIMLHPSAVEGDDGLIAMKAILDTYMKKYGMSMQFNVFNSSLLRDAQKNPEKYKNLQVRVCGWNVLWNNLSKAEQDSYILRAENIQ